MKTRMIRLAAVLFLSLCLMSALTGHTNALELGDLGKSGAFIGSVSGTAGSMEFTPDAELRIHFSDEHVWDLYPPSFNQLFGYQFITEEGEPVPYDQAEYLLLLNREDGTYFHRLPCKAEENKITLYPGDDFEAVFERQAQPAAPGAGEEAADLADADGDGGYSGNSWDIAGGMLPKVTQTKDAGDWEESDAPYEHMGPVATVLIAIISAIAAALGGAVGGGAAGVAAGGIGALPEPESMVIETAQGAQILVTQDPASGDWINVETGNVLDVSKHQELIRQQGQSLAEQRARDAELERRGQTSMQQAGRERRQADAERQAAIAKEMKGDRRELRYGTRDQTASWAAFKKSQALEQRMVDVWNKAADNIEWAEFGARSTVVVTDTLIDGLANIGGPGAKMIRAGYKVTKEICGTMAEEGISTTSFVSGVVKGGSDAGSDYIKNPYWKAAVTAGGEAVGQGISKGWQGVAEGAVDGIVKAGVDALPGVFTKGYGADAEIVALNNGQVRISWVTNAGTWAEKTTTSEAGLNYMNQKLKREISHTAVKGMGLMANEFGRKR